MVKNDAFALNVDGSIGGIERLLWTAQAARIKDVQPVPIRIIRLMGVTVQQNIGIFAARLVNQLSQAVLHIPLVSVYAVKLDILDIGNQRILLIGAKITVSADTPLLHRHSIHRLAEIAQTIPQKDEQFRLWLLLDDLFDSLHPAVGIG